MDFFAFGPARARESPAATALKKKNVLSVSDGLKKNAKLEQNLAERVLLKYYSSQKEKNDQRIQIKLIEKNNYPDVVRVILTKNVGAFLWNAGPVSFAGVLVPEPD